MKQAVLIRYNANPGQMIKKGDCIFEIETDKAALQVESNADGCVKHLLADIGQTIRVGDPVVILADKNEKVPREYIKALKNQLAKTGLSGSAQKTGTEVEKAPDNRSFNQTSAVPEEQIKLGSSFSLSQKQKVIGRKMLWSKRNIPCFYLRVSSDVTALTRLRENLNKTAHTPVSYNDFLIFAVTRALKKFPLMTGSLRGGKIILPENINIALAVRLPHGLAAPVIKNTHKKKLPEITGERKKLTEKTAAGKLTLQDLQDACITISNLGNLGIDSFIPIVVPGQCSILGVGKITDTCRADNNFASEPEKQIVIRKMMSLTLAVDHRIANGTQASQFLDFLRKYLQEPENFIPDAAEQTR